MDREDAWNLSEPTPIPDPPPQWIVFVGHPNDHKREMFRGSIVRCAGFVNRLSLNGCKNITIEQAH